jgi:hypothetical protein
VRTQGVGEQIVADFKRFDWMWAQSLPIQLGWGRLTSNVLFVGTAAARAWRAKRSLPAPARASRRRHAARSRAILARLLAAGAPARAGDRGHVTPAHYDEQQNLLAQLCGRKRVVLWAASDARSLFPFPLRHAHDRQSRLDLDGEGGVGADDVRFGRFAAAPAFEALLEPGDALFIPQYWWHRVENLDDGCVSVNFWFVDSEPKPMQVRRARARAYRAAPSARCAARVADRCVVRRTRFATSPIARRRRSARPPKRRCGATSSG